MRPLLGLREAVNFLNIPSVKAGVKTAVGTITFIFGVVESYDIYRMIYEKKDSAETNTSLLSSAKISLILSATTSWPSVFVISKIAGHLFSNKQLESAFGPNTIFAINPCHPRHLVSFAAVILSLPSVTHSIYKGACWAYAKVRLNEKLQISHITTKDKSCLTARTIHFMALFNTITSRPFQHLGNQLCRSYLQRVYTESTPKLGF